MFLSVFIFVTKMLFSHNEIKSCKKNLHKKSNDIPLSWKDMM